MSEHASSVGSPNATALVPPSDRAPRPDGPDGPDALEVVSDGLAPFAMVPRWLLVAGLVSDGALRLYAVLTGYAAMRDGARPSLSKLADDLGVSRDTVRRRTAELEEVGALTVKTRRQGSSTLPHRYVIHHNGRDGRHGRPEPEPEVTEEVRTPVDNRADTVRSTGSHGCEGGGSTGATRMRTTSVKLTTSPDPSAGDGPVSSGEVEEPQEEEGSPREGQKDNPRTGEVLDRVGRVLPAATRDRYLAQLEEGRTAELLDAIDGALDRRWTVSEVVATLTDNLPDELTSPVGLLVRRVKAGKLSGGSPSGRAVSAAPDATSSASGRPASPYDQLRADDRAAADRVLDRFTAAVLDGIASPTERDEWLDGLALEELDGSAVA